MDAPDFRYQLSTPVGPLSIEGTDQQVVNITWGLRPAGLPLQALPAPLQQAAQELAAYFEGDGVAFTPELYTASGSAFQVAVWQAVQAIPYGQTRSYGEIGAAIGKPKAAQAIGQCVGANALPIVVPCHRVVGADGSLTGFAYGLEKKRFLLDLEQSKRYGKQGSLF